MKNKEIHYIISELQSREEWMKFIQRLIQEERKPFYFNNYTVLEFLIALDDYLITQLETKQLFHDCLMDYYISLRPVENNSQYFSLLHYLFSRIRPTSSSFEFIERQLLSKELVDLYDGRTNLHASLMASIRSYITVRNKTIETFIFNTFESNINSNVFDSNLVFLYRRSTSDIFFNYINIVLGHNFASMPNLLIDIISSNLELYFVEIGETYFKIFEWYFNLLKNNGFEKNQLIIELDKRLVKWINYSEEGIKQDQYGLLLLTLINNDILLPFEHFRILSSYEGKDINNLRSEIIEHYLINIYKKKMGYGINLKNGDSPIIHDHKIEHCFYDIRTTKDISGYWDYCVSRLSCNIDLYKKISYGDYIYGIVEDSIQEEEGNHYSDSISSFMPLQSLATIP